MPKTKHFFDTTVKPGLEDIKDDGRVIQREGIVQAKDGNIIHFISLVNICNIENSNNDATWYTRSFLRDNTDKIMRESALAAQYEHELTKSMLDLKTTFIRFVSHEIRSPLTVVHALEDSFTKCLH